MEAGAKTQCQKAKAAREKSHFDFSFDLVSCARATAFRFRVIRFSF
jgi:hypothetical protein